MQLHSQELWLFLTSSCYIEILICTGSSELTACINKCGSLLTVLLISFYVCVKDDMVPVCTVICVMVLMVAYCCFSILVNCVGIVLACSYLV